MFYCTDESIVLLKEIFCKVDSFDLIVLRLFIFFSREHRITINYILINTQSENK
jgi:hypothetical protein